MAMISEQTIHTIVEEVLKRLRHDDDAPVAVVLGEQSESLAAALADILEPGTRLSFHDGCGALPPAERYILPVLSCTDMADLAVGRAFGKTASAVLELLLAGREVEVVEFAYRKHVSSAPGALYALYEQYEKTLAAFGLKAIRPRRQEAVRLRQELVTAREVAQAAQNGASVIEVRAGAIITPLAADAAREKGVTVIRR